MSAAAVRVIIQCRTGSRRLPGKALLPLGGMPAAVLCARRASNRGHAVVMAIPEGAADEALAHTLAANRIALVRGSEDDVLDRFARSADGLADQAIVVRFTADNVVPDGDFVERLVARFRAAGRDYFGTWSPVDGLPYGLSGEVFTAGMLRKAAAQATAAFDREHVTPWIVRASQPSAPDLREWYGGDGAHLRCTIDSLADYRRVERALRDTADPVNAGWRDICTVLQAQSPVRARVPWKLAGREVHSTLTIGGAQLGIPYGIANRDGLPSQSQAERILTLALDAGITAVDCARAYGECERRVGAFLAQGHDGQMMPITKLDPLVDLDPAATADQARQAVDASVFRSCTELGVRRLPVVLLHRWEHRRAAGGAVWARLRELKTQGYIGRLGASVYRPEAALEALADPEIDQLQLPFNLLDWRWHAAGVPQAARARPEVIVHLRSALLQGVVTLPAERWPAVRGIDAAALCRELQRLARELGRESVTDLSVAYARSQDWATSIVLGQETAAQLEDNIRLFHAPALSADEVELVRTRIPRVPEQLLDPSLWPRAA